MLTSPRYTYLSGLSAAVPPLLAELREELLASFKLNRRWGRGAVGWGLRMRMDGWDWGWGLVSQLHTEAGDRQLHQDLPVARCACARTCNRSTVAHQTRAPWEGPT